MQNDITVWKSPSRITRRFLSSSPFHLIICALEYIASSKTSTISGSRRRWQIETLYRNVFVDCCHVGDWGINNWQITNVWGTSYLFMTLGVEFRPSRQIIFTFGGALSGQHVHKISISCHIVLMTIAVFLEGNVRTLIFERYGSSHFACVGNNVDLWCFYCAVLLTHGCFFS